METPKELFEKTSYFSNKIELINDSTTNPFWIKPSDITIIAQSFLKRGDMFTSSFGSCEGETTAYLICRFFAENGDCWFPVTVQTLNDFVRKEEKNYFYEVEVFAKRGEYAQLSLGKIVFTNRFIERCAGFRGKEELEGWKAKTIFELV
jgi:hypothetical protein